MSEIRPPQRHPLYLFAILILLMMGGSAIFGMVGVMIAGLIYGFGNISNPDHIGFLRILQSSLSVGTFIAPAWFFPRFCSISAPQFLKLLRSSRMGHPVEQTNATTRFFEICRRMDAPKRRRNPTIG